MNVTTEPYKITKREFFRRVFSTFKPKQDTFDVYPSTQHRLNIVRTAVVVPEGTAYSVGFTFDGVEYYLPSESKFVACVVA